MVGLSYPYFFSRGFKKAFYTNNCAILTYFRGKLLNLKELFERNSQFWEMADLA
jgi:hypothetical protein